MKKPKPAKAAKPAKSAKAAKSTPRHHHHQHPALTPQQQRQANRAQIRSLQRQLHNARHPAPVKKTNPARKPRGLAGVPLTGGWLPGGNDVLDSCAAAAVANHRLWATGQPMSDAEIIALFRAAGGCLEDVLEAAGCRFCPVEDDGTPGLVLGVELPGPHAVLATSGGWVSWGGLIRPVGVVEEAWWVEWPDDR